MTWEVWEEQVGCGVGIGFSSAYYVGTRLPGELSSRLLAPWIWSSHMRSELKGKSVRHQHVKGILG